MTQNKLTWKNKGLSVVMALFAIPHIFPVPALSAQISPETEAAWEKSVSSIRNTLAHDGSALLPWNSSRGLTRVSQRSADASPKASVYGEVNTVPSGLIHHWVGTALVGHALPSDVLSTLQHYDSYKSVFAPAVVESKLKSHTGDEFCYQLKFIQKGFGLHVGLLGSFRTTYYRINAERGYSFTEATDLVEINRPGEQDESSVERTKSFGYVEKTITIVRYQQVSGGTIVQIESLTLSRGLSASVRWIVIPVIRRFSQQTMAMTLTHLRGNIQATGDKVIASSIPNRIFVDRSKDSLQ
jgi:hypothetical protein